MIPIPFGTFAPLHRPGLNLDESSALTHALALVDCTLYIVHVLGHFHFHFSFHSPLSLKLRIPYILYGKSKAPATCSIHDASISLHDDKYIMDLSLAPD